MTSQGPHRKQRAHPEWGNLRRVYLQRKGDRGTSKNSVVRSQGFITSGRRDSDQNRKRVMQSNCLRRNQGLQSRTHPA